MTVVRREPADRAPRRREVDEGVVDDRPARPSPRRARRCARSARSRPAPAPCARRRAPRPAGRCGRRGPGRRARRTSPTRAGDQQQRDRARAARRGSPACAPGRRLVASRGRSQTASITSDLEEAHPAELGELGLVRVEHELARVREAQLEDPALALALHHRVGELGRLERRAGREVVEEVGVHVERVDRGRTRGRSRGRSAPARRASTRIGSSMYAKAIVLTA